MIYGILRDKIEGMSGGKDKHDSYTFDKVTAVNVVTGRECVLLSREEAKKGYIVSEIHLYANRLICLIQKDKSAYDYFMCRYTELPRDNLNKEFELLDIKLNHNVGDF